MSELSLRQAVVEARKFSAFVRAFEKLEKVADALVNGENLLAEIKAATEQARNQMELAKAEADSAKESVELAKAHAKKIIDDSVAKAGAAIAEADARNSKAEQNIKTSLVSADAVIASKREHLRELDERIAARRIEFGDLEKKIEMVHSQASKLLGG